MSEIYRILSLDGGIGGGGALSIGLLKRLQRECPGFLESVDIFTGTSAGSMNASIIATRPSADDGLADAESYWDEIFSYPKPGLLRLALSLTGRVPLGESDTLKMILQSFLNDMTFGDVKRNMIIPAFQMDNETAFSSERCWSIRLFSNLLDFLPERSDFLVDLIMRSSAAPIVQPVYQGFADGGILPTTPACLPLCMLWINWRSVSLSL